MSISSTIGILEWRNECVLSGYPLKNYSDVLTGVIADAYWLQLDGYVPLLQKVSVTTAGVAFSVLTCFGTVTGTSVSGETVSLYDSIAHRLVGKLYMGDNFNTFKADNLGQMVTVNIPFIGGTVYSLPSSAGVFSFDGATGAVGVVSDDNIHFSSLGAAVRCDAISVAPLLPAQPLFSINGITANSLTLETNDVLTWSFAADGLNVSLVTGGLDGTSVHPSTNT